MDVAWLESLLALMEHRSFTRAAESLYISQPAFSRRIRALENWVGADLVDRSTSPVQLTEAALKIYPWAAEFVTGFDSLRDEIRGNQLTPNNAVRISVTHTLATHYFAPWWSTITADSGGLTCVILPSNTLEAYDSILHGGCELLMAYADPVRPLHAGNDKLESIVVAQDLLRPYSRSHQRSPIFDLPGTANNPVPFVSHGSGAFLGRITDRILSAQKPHLKPTVQSDLTAVLAGFVFAGTGIGWLPGIIGDHESASDFVIALPGTIWQAKLEVRLFRDRGRESSVAAKSVWERALEKAAQL